MPQRHRLLFRVRNLSCALAAFLICGPLAAAEVTLVSPDGALSVTVSDSGGLAYRVSRDGSLILKDSKLGLDFEGGFSLGPKASIGHTTRASKDDHWENPFGKRRAVRDRYNEMKLELAEAGTPVRSFALIVRAYDDGVAFRYDLPRQSALTDFVLTNERTEFVFAGDYRCWAGGESSCAENQYPETKLSDIPGAAKNSVGRPVPGVLPLLVETPGGYVAVAESDLLDWAGMSVTGTGTPGVAVVLARRSDGRGLVVSTTPRVSPWRVLMITRGPAEMITSDLVANLATPSRLDEVSWIKPGACAWDAWWTGENPYDPSPRHRGVYARGTTPSHKDYIDFAQSMGWPYQLMDWFWYENMTSYDKSLRSEPNAKRGDFTRAVPEVDVPGLVAYAKTRNVRLFIWAHSLDVETFGVEKTMAHFAGLGLAGVKIDFINSESQEAVRWCEKVLAEAARHRLLVDFHGACKPAGLARTYPNFITQEGVLGNEYNKLNGNRCTPRHTITLPFTRGLLGPMDFTPGGFLNRTPKDFKAAVPAQVMGTRARQLAMTVIYESPLLVLCDSPAHYRGRPGIEFLREIPTVWDETFVPLAEVAKHVVVARRHGSRWYLAAMNGDDAATLQVPLKFLASGRWTLRAFSDTGESAAEPEKIAEQTRTVTAADSVVLSLAPAGGYAAILESAETP